MSGPPIAKRTMSRSVTKCMGWYLNIEWNEYGVVYGAKYSGKT